MKHDEVKRTMRRVAPALYRRAAEAYWTLRRMPLRPPSGQSQRHLQIITSIARQAARVSPDPLGKRIVFFTVRGWPVHVAVESLLASRLRALGHDIRFLICADSLPFCMISSVHAPPELQRPCELCCGRKNSAFADIFPTETLPAWHGRGALGPTLDGLSLQECRSFTYEGVPYGEICFPSVVWYLRRATLSDGDAELYRNVIASAHVVRVGMEACVLRDRPDAVVMLNGDFFAERMAAYVLGNSGIRFVTHDYSFAERLAVGLNRSTWDHVTFDKQAGCAPAISTQRERAEALLAEWRNRGGYQGELFWSTTTLEAPEEGVRASIGLDERPVAAAFTNMTFESSVVGKDRIYPGQREWLTALVAHFAARPQWQLVIRVHPAEQRLDYWAPTESLEHYVRTALTPLPDNVRVLGPDVKVSSYAIGAVARAITVYTSTIGMEFVERSRSVIVVGHVHYAGRGFTIDPESSSAYLDAIDRSMRESVRLSDEERRRLVDYVAWFFFVRLCPFEPLTGIAEDWPRVTVKNLRDLSAPTMQGFNQLVQLIADGVPWW